eukprot:gene47425-58092_t
MASDLIPLPARTLRLGMTLPYDLFDANGKLLFARGQVLRDSPLVRSLVDGGGWVNSEDTMEYQRARAHRLDTLVMQDVPLSDIAKADSSFRMEQLSAAKVELGPREAWSDLLLHTHTLLREPESDAEMTAFSFYGPTCDDLDHMAGPFFLPADIKAGDFIEIGMLGAYGCAMRTKFNGFG